MSRLAVLTLISSAIDAMHLPDAPGAAVAAASCDFAAVAFYRAWNGGCTDHLYSTSLDEMAVEARAGYALEGEAGRVLATNASGSIPLYRLWNAVFTDHFYTPDANERDAVLSSCSTWSYEGVSAYILPQAACGTVPLYRTFRGGAAYDHFYTANPVEKDRAVQEDGYLLEGIVGYVWF